MLSKTLLYVALVLAVVNVRVLAGYGGDDDDDYKNHHNDDDDYGKERKYYIQAEEVEWNYAPLLNLDEYPPDYPKDEPGDHPDPNTWLGHTENTIGKKYMKCLYFEYEDSDFSKKIKKPIDHGILGPVIRAEVYDTIKVYYRNKCSFKTSIHPHGVTYTKHNEGASYNEEPDLDWGGDFPNSIDSQAVPPRHKFMYKWTVPEVSGPGPNDPSSIVWLYHSHIHETPETNSGLVGTIIICKDHCHHDGSPKDVDREYILYLNIINENASPLLDTNQKKYLGKNWKLPKGDTAAADYEESNLKHSVNGYMFNTLPGIVATEGDIIRWYLIALGNEVDLHSAHFHGHTVLTEGHRTDVIELFPASMKVADTYAFNVGDWMFHCHVHDHFDAGMTAMYSVRPKDQGYGYSDFNSKLHAKLEKLKRKGGAHNPR